jgi:hypothetical protein
MLERMVGTTSHVAGTHALSVHIPLQHCEPNMHSLGLLSGMQQCGSIPEPLFFLVHSRPPQQSSSLLHRFPGEHTTHFEFLHALPAQHSLSLVQVPPDE